jgi:hypothetical protein
VNVLLDRWQFVVTITYHFLFVPLTIGLALLVAVMQVLAYRRRDEAWDRLGQRTTTGAAAGRVPQRRLDIRALAFGHPFEELVDAEASASASVYTHGFSSAGSSARMCRASPRGRRSASVCSTAWAALRYVGRAGRRPPARWPR